MDQVIWGLVAIFGVAASWDVLRRHIAKSVANSALIERVRLLEQEAEKTHGLVQNVAQRLSMQSASTSTRLVR